MDYVYELFIEIIKQIISEQNTSTKDNRGEETNE